MVSLSNHEKVLESIKKLPDQAAQAWEEAGALKIPDNFENAKNIVISGMGGSGLPADFVLSNFFPKVPIFKVNGELPAWANKETLVIFMSYSGTTSEIIEEIYDMQDSTNEKEFLYLGVIGITSNKAWKENFPEQSAVYVFDSVHNPSNQPRLGTGYGIFALLRILSKLGYLVNDYDLPQDDKQLEDLLGSLRSYMDEAEREGSKLADFIKDTNVLIFGSENLVGNAHIFANQLNETSKTFATWFTLPEANHHLLEGLKHPNNECSAIFLGPKQKRLTITQEVLEKNGIKTMYLETSRDKHFEGALKILLVSSFASLKLAELYEEDPLSIPTVDYFKKELEKS